MIRLMFSPPSPNGTQFISGRRWIRGGGFIGGASGRLRSERKAGEQNEGSNEGLKAIVWSDDGTWPKARICRGSSYNDRQDRDLNRQCIVPSNRSPLWILCSNSGAAITQAVRPCMLWLLYSYVKVFYIKTTGSCHFVCAFTSIIIT